MLGRNKVGFGRMGSKETVERSGRHGERAAQKKIFKCSPTDDIVAAHEAKHAT